MNILGIETSCDETAAAVVADGRRILSNVIASQVEIHARYGGVVPEVASRQHILSIVPVIERALADARVDWANIHGLAFTNGPGLAGSLLVGVSAAKAIAAARRLPMTAVNHLEGHIYANWLVPASGPESAPPEFPVLCLIVSGGHSDLVLMSGHGEYTRLGRTRDDAAGEAFDKAARILGVGYPGGPAIEKAAERGAPTLPLTRSWLKGSDDFSFSGVKTALVNIAREKGFSAASRESKGLAAPGEKEISSLVADAAASFQQAVVEVLVTKTVQAALRLRVRQLLLAGGVAANRLLGRQLREQSPVPVFIPPLALCTDNAAMVASCGYYRLSAGKVASMDVDVIPNLTIG
jgi:N6-L-threonylcarbamoyladenine synthase